MALFSNNLMAIFAGIMAVTLALLYRVNWLDAFSMVYIPWIFIQIADFFFMALSYRIFGELGMEPLMLLRIGWERGIYLLLFAAGLLGLTRWVRIKPDVFSHIRWRYFWEILLIPVMTVVMIYFQRVYVLYAHPEAASQQFAVNWGFFGMTVVLFGCFLFIYVQRQQVQENDRMLQMKLAMLEENYNQVLGLYEEKSALLHDEKHHMRVLRGYLAEEKVGDAVQYVEEVAKDLEESSRRIWSGHPLLDLILNMKAQEAKRQGIRTEIRFDSMLGLRLKDTEVCALFANLLDNAIEANRKVPEGQERWLSLRGERKGDMLIVNLSNAAAQKAQMRGGRLVTSKEDERHHGFGMQSIERVLKAHEGDMEIEAEEDRFSIVLYLLGFDEK